MLGTNAEPYSVDMSQQEEADFESEDDCKIPLIVLSPPNHAEVNKIFYVKDKTVVVSLLLKESVKCSMQRSYKIIFELMILI